MCSGRHRAARYSGVCRRMRNRLAGQWSYDRSFHMTNHGLGFVFLRRRINCKNAAARYAMQLAGSKRTMIDPRRDGAVVESGRAIPRAPVFPDSIQTFDKRRRKSAILAGRILVQCDRQARGR